MLLLVVGAEVVVCLAAELERGTHNGWWSTCTAVDSRRYLLGILRENVGFLRKLAFVRRFEFEYVLLYVTEQQ